MNCPSEVASESGHFYTKTGEPCYEIMGKNGKLRPTTVRDMRTLDLLPSVTSVISMLPKPGLIIWQKKNVLMSALTLPRLPDELDDAYIARIMADADEQSRLAREKGIAIHGAIERFICGQAIEPEYDIYVRSAINALSEHIGVIPMLDKCEAEKSFADIESLYGGKVDLFSRELNVIVDFKTKDFTEDTDKLAWDEHIIQLTAYKMGLGMPDARMINVFVSTSVPGLVRIVEHPDGDPRYWQIFMTCMTLWRLIKKV